MCVGEGWGGVAGRDVTRKRSPNRETNVVTSKYWVILDTGEGKRAVQYPLILLSKSPGVLKFLLMDYIKELKIRSSF